MVVVVAMGLAGMASMLGIVGVAGTIFMGGEEFFGGAMPFRADGGFLNPGMGMGSRVADCSGTDDPQNPG